MSDILNLINNFILEDPESENSFILIKKINNLLFSNNYELLINKLLNESKNIKILLLNYINNYVNSNTDIYNIMNIMLYIYINMNFEDYEFNDLKPIVNSILAIFKIGLKRTKNDDIINLIKLNFNIENKSLLQEYKIWKFLANIKINNYHIGIIILNYIELNIDYYINIVNNFNKDNLIIQIKIVKLIYSIISFLINLNIDEIVLLIFNNTKLRNFNNKIFFFNYNQNINYFIWNLNEKLSKEILQIRSIVFEPIINLMNLNNNLNINWNDFFPIKNFISIIVKDLIDFYTNSKYDLNYKIELDFLSIISEFLKFILELFKHNFFNEFSENDIFLDLIDLRLYFLRLDYENCLEFDEYPKEFYYKFITILKNEKTYDNIKYCYLNLIDILIEKLDYFFFNILKKIEIDLQNFKDDNIILDFILLSFILKFFNKNNNAIVLSFKNNLKNFLIICDNKCNYEMTKFFVFMFFSISINILFTEEDYSFIETYIKNNINNLDLKVKNNNNDAYLYCIVKEFKNSLLNNSIISKIIKQNINKIIENWIELILINDNIIIIKLFNSILRKNIFYFNDNENILKIENLIMNSLNKFLDTDYHKSIKIMQFYEKLLNYKIFKNKTNIVKLLNLLLNSLSLNLKDKNITISFLNIISTYNNINFEIFNLMYKVIQLEENQILGLKNYLEIIYNMELNEEQSLIILEFLNVIVINIKKGFQWSDDIFIKFILIILFSKLIDSISILNKINYNNYLTKIYTNLSSITDDDINKLYFINLLNIISIIWIKNNFSWKIINIDYKIKINEILSNELEYCDIFSRIYLVYLYIYLIYNNFDDKLFIKKLYNKIILNINLIKIDYEKINHDLNDDGKINEYKSYYNQIFWEILNKLDENSTGYEIFYNVILKIRKDIDNINDSDSYFSDDIENNFLEPYNIKIYFNEINKNQIKFFESLLIEFYTLTNYMKNNIDLKQLIITNNEKYYKEINKIKILYKNNVVYFRKNFNIK